MEYVARSSVIAEVPAARVAYLGVLTSLASGPQGAQVQTAFTAETFALKLFPFLWLHVQRCGLVSAAHFRHLCGGS